MMSLTGLGSRSQIIDIRYVGSGLMISLLMFLSILFSNTGIVHASDPDQIGEFPQYVRDSYSATCSSPTIDRSNATFSNSGGNAGQVTWLSLEGQPSATNFVVQSGSTLNLQLNIGSLNCAIPQNTTASTYWYIAGGSASSLVGREIIASYPSTRRFNRTGIVFQYTAPTGITSPTLVTLTVDAIPVNNRPSGSPRFQCIKPPSVNAGAYNNWRACYFPVGTHWRTVSENVMVTPSDTSPIGDINSNWGECNRLIGWTFDRDNPNASIDVHVYLDGRFYNAGPTNVLRQDVNNFYGITGNHGFDISIPAVANAVGVDIYDGNVHNLEVYGINIGLSASHLRMVKTVGPCARPPTGTIDPFDPAGNRGSTCSVLRGTASDGDWNGNINVIIRRNGAQEAIVTTNGGAWSYEISQYRGFSVNSFEVVAVGVDRNGTPNNNNVSLGTIGIGPCATAACQPFTTIGLVEEGLTFKIRTGVNIDSGAQGGGATVTARINITGANITPSVPVSQTITFGSNLGFEWDVNIANSGFYGGNIRFNINGIETICDFGGYPNCDPNTPKCAPVCPPDDPTCCPPGTCTPCLQGSDRCPLVISVKPYFKVFGGNVVAGVTDTSCELGSADSSTSSGRILAFSKGDGNGSGTQLIAQALDIIEGFSSAQGPAGNSSPDKGLSLSNTVGNPTYGGAFGPASCPDIPIQGVTASLFSNPGALAPGEKQVIYVTGDVTISNNITYAGGSWTDIDQIPSFTLVVTGGNIYIDKDVTELHGIFVAKPSGGSGGSIYTCTKGGVSYSAAELSTGATQNDLPCSKPLTVYGSFMAKQVKLLRTNGKTGNASNTHTWNAILTPETAPAEKFIYTPELWIRSNGAGTTSEKGKLDSLKPLPPVL